MANTLLDYAIPFAAWEVRLFLDTHPTDTRALATYQQLCAECGVGSYACLPASEYGLDRWRWIDDPWPWEPEANCPAARQAAAPCGQCSQCRANRSRTNSCARRV